MHLVFVMELLPTPCPVEESVMYSDEQNRQIGLPGQVSGQQQRFGLFRRVPENRARWCTWTHTPKALTFVAVAEVVEVAKPVPVD